MTLNILDKIYKKHHQFYNKKPLKKITRINKMNYI